MKTNRIFLFFSLVLLSVFSGEIMAQKVAVYQSKWHPGMEVNDEEGLINRMQYDDKSKIMFLVTNNEDLMYVDFMSSDQAVIQKVMRYGLTTWVNVDGKTKKTLGIEFPRSPEETGEPVFRKEKGGDRKAMMMAMMESKNKEMELIGFEGKGTRTIIDPRVDPLFEGNIQMKEGGKIHVRLEIPMAKLGRGRETGNFSPVSLGFETGYMDVTGQGSAGGGSMQGGGGYHGGGGMGPGGGMPGGGPPPGGGQAGDAQGAGPNQQQPDISKLASPSRLWIKELQLSERQ